MKLTIGKHYLMALALLAGAFAAAAAQTSPHWTVDAVVEQMDRAAAGFRTLTADLEHSKYTDVVKDTSVETGRIFVRRDEKMRIEILKPDPRTILRSGDTLFVFTPKIKRVEEYDLGKSRAMVDQYVLLGFGTRGEDLKKSYLLTVLGEAPLDNRKTVLLELTPKSEKVRSQISKIQMWVDQTSWIPVQQKFFETGSGDYFIFHYTNLVLNSKIGNGRFKPDWPKGVTRIKPRG
ncbi:MAG: outer membrane lipoprotein carrier protein LolA [Acidobacteriia bacterium]|nr:outer membrane lipoprotein carrier protein LolA [Terriglobia bacterium]